MNVPDSIVYLLIKLIKIWSINTGQTSRTINTGSEVFSLKLLSNGFYLAAGLGDYKIQILNINTGSLITTLNGHTGRVRDLVLIGNLLANSSEDSVNLNSGWKNSKVSFCH